jgi:hypothetical protein
MHDIHTHVNAPHCALGRRLHEPIDVLNVVDALYVGRQAAVHTQKLIVEQRCQWQRIERVHNSVVDVQIVFVQTLRNTCQVSRAIGFIKPHF